MKLPTALLVSVAVYIGAALGIRLLRLLLLPRVNRLAISDAPTMPSLYAQAIISLFFPREKPLSHDVPMVKTEVIVDLGS
jgi:hypothetical protein